MGGIIPPPPKAKIITKGPNGGEFNATEMQFYHQDFADEEGGIVTLPVVNFRDGSSGWQEVKLVDCTIVPPTA